MQTFLPQVITSLPDATRVSLLAFSAAVAVFDLSRSNAVAAHVLPGDGDMDEAVLRAVKGSLSACLAPLGECRPAALAAIKSLRPTQQGRHRERPRCTGAAIEAGLHILSLAQASRADAAAAAAAPHAQTGMSRAATPMDGRMLIGPGRVPVRSLDRDDRAADAHSLREGAKAFQRLAQAAADLGAAVDILGTGMSAVNVPLLSTVARASGGSLTLHAGYSGISGANLAASLQRQVGRRGTLEVYASPGLAVTRIIGPVTDLPAGWTRNGAAAKRAKRGGGCAAVALRAVERGTAVSFHLDVVKPLEAKAYVQVVLSWQDSAGRTLRRVVTRKLQTTTVLSAYVRHVDVPLAAVLLAKGVVQDAVRSEAAAHGELAPIRASIGKHLQHVAACFGEATWETPEQPGWFSRRRKLWKLPHQLRLFAEVLYQLQRGPVLGTVMGHADEKALLHSVLLGSPLDLSQSLLLPVLHIHNRETGHFDVTPAANLALSPGAAAVLDHGSHIFVWHGSALSSFRDCDSVRASCLDHAVRLSSGRFPIPDLRVVTQGTGDARYVSARLMPLQHDSPEEQLSQVPGLAALSTKDRAALILQQPPTDEFSFLGWCRSLAVDVPAAPDSLSAVLAHMSVQ
ncbi:hypothetical protein COCSUDRAFT_55218 [Coccomyxa subellipsoidea C-169]|uniref:Protein transport protein SEC23 n=1 Tax=Coccomyxa subellipsoidea (strain C-169) TaxID=574566 RepID=I0Z976_COCSC|nr:hypothetical protein COCSUDRAFT_55218 [Coccomyxa subellipsoidea C-169]EIE27195.1 hypothetical protein COCSUDRAFT_55218 [Coccomyxa subellipsoidea C-169]|eukprot:XP_005651739.1 hypothetical protein COCSUDRAFT_55218 [Coccomyxa subellipsoidea C-169]